MWNKYFFVFSQILIFVNCWIYFTHIRYFSLSDTKNFIMFIILAQLALFSRVYDSKCN